MIRSDKTPYASLVPRAVAILAQAILDKVHAPKFCRHHVAALEALSSEDVLCCMSRWQSRDTNCGYDRKEINQLQRQARGDRDSG